MLQQAHDIRRWESYNEVPTWTICASKYVKAVATRSEPGSKPRTWDCPIWAIELIPLKNRWVQPIKIVERSWKLKAESVSQKYYEIENLQCSKVKHYSKLACNFQFVSDHEIFSLWKGIKGEEDGLRLSSYSAQQFSCAVHHSSWYTNRSRREKWRTFAIGGIIACIYFLWVLTFHDPFDNELTLFT